mmetsp:Transcript_12568/g.27168  ORF Transcript_12568/g.27168 Transcript_12568/m.27168 type:complete len:260 (+) Transcript_12568:2365-3144(+)
MEERHSLLVQTEIPSHHHVLLGLRRLLGSVVVGLELHQRSKHVLVLVGILVPQLYGLQIGFMAMDAPLVQILQGGIGLLLPELLQLVHLTLTDREWEKILVLWNVHHPRKESPVLNQRLPFALVPGYVLEGPVGQTNTAQNHDHGLGLPGDKTQDENVSLSTIVALQNSVPQTVLRVQLYFLLLGPHKVQHDAAPWKPWKLGVAEPLSIPTALHHRTRIVGATVAASPLRQVRPVESLVVAVDQPLQIPKVQIGCSRPQ